jgi:hypothetical protein
MCGIAGVLTEATAESGVALVERIVASQYQWRPDHQACEEVKTARLHATFGYDRLSIWKRGFDVEQDAWIGRGLGAPIRTAIAARRAAVEEWIVPDVRVDEAFSDRALARRRGAFAEATTLIWLGGLRR